MNEETKLTARDRLIAKREGYIRCLTDLWGPSPDSYAKAHSAYPDPDPPPKRHRVIVHQQNRYRYNPGSRQWEWYYNGWRRSALNDRTVNSVEDRTLAWMLDLRRNPWEARG